MKNNKEKAHAQKEGGRRAGKQLPEDNDSVNLNNTNQGPQILIFTVINFIQTSSRLTGFVWESSGNLMCL